MTDTNYYEDAQRDANRGADVANMLDAVQAAQRELDDLRWQRDQADSYGSHMRHCLHPIPFEEWVARQRAHLVGKTIAADDLIGRLRERRDEVQP